MSTEGKDTTEELAVKAINFGVEFVKAILSISVLGIFRVFGRIFTAVKNDIQSEKS